LGLQADVAGILNVQGGVSAQGYQYRELLSSLDGNLVMALEDLEIQGAAYDLLATDLLAWIYSGAALQKSTHVDCTMASFRIDDGVANSNDFFAESRHMVATGKGELDLGREKMNITVTPRSKDRLLQIPSNIRVYGDIRKPRTWMAPLAATADASAEALMLIPSLALKVLGLKRTPKTQERPCATEPIG
ncbi:MAG: AsmA-like C-terminal region-containing protein, partial [Parahaliea sp.]